MRRIIMKGFTISVDISATRFGNPYHLKASTTINVDDDTKLDEIMDVPIGQLILGSAYKPKVSDDDMPTVDLCPG
jgi:hypothetical protein